MPEPSSRLRSSPLLSGAAAQALGAILALVFLFIIPEMGQNPWMLVAIQGAGAAIASERLGAPSWWQLIHLGFGPAVLAASRLAIPPWVWLIGFVLLLLVFGRTDRSRVPLYLTNRTAARSVAKLLPQHPCFFADIGCGNGGVIKQLAELRPDSEFVGIEHAPLTFLWAKIRTRHLSNVHIRYGDYWLQPLTPYDLVYAFLSPAPMTTLWDKVQHEMRPETVLVSNSFPITETDPTEIVAVEDGRRTRLYVYRLPAQADGITPNI